MKIVLQDGGRITTLEGSDTLIVDSINYLGLFDRKVTEATHAFYAKEVRPPAQEAPHE